MQSQTIDGVGSINEGEYDRLEISGVGTGRGNLKVKLLQISGVFKGKGTVEADKIICDGVGEFGDSVRANSVFIDGVLKLSSGAKLEAESITCEGFISLKAELSADKLVVDGCIKATEIYGEEIIIHSKEKSNVHFYGLLKGVGDILSSIGITKGDGSDVDLIEATNITLRNVIARQVNGNNITIGENCVIDHVDCNGSLRVHKTAVVKNITGATAKEI